MARGLQQERQAVGAVLAVVGDEDLPAHARAPGFVAGAAAFDLDGDRERQRDRELAALARALALHTATLPPCISVICFTSVKPMPSPVCERRMSRLSCTNMPNTFS